MPIESLIKGISGFLGVLEINVPQGFGCFPSPICGSATVSVSTDVSFDFNDVLRVTGSTSDFEVDDVVAGSELHRLFDE
jgi:hypothetical protein